MCKVKEFKNSQSQIRLIIKKQFAFDFSLLTS